MAAAAGVGPGCGGLAAMKIGILRIEPTGNVDIV